jgi:hypothetical protein
MLCFTGFSPMLTQSSPLPCTLDMLLACLFYTISDFLFSLVLVLSLIMLRNPNPLRGRGSVMMHLAGNYA